VKSPASKKEEGTEEPGESGLLPKKMNWAATPTMDGLIAEQARLRACAEGDAYAWRELHAAYLGKARSFLRRLGVHHEDLEDACQEVFIEAYRYLPGFRGDASFSTWLYRICMTQARRDRRKRTLRGTLERWLSLSPPALHADPQRAVSAHLVEAALGTLSDLERPVFVLFELEGLSGREVATVLECTEATVYRRLYYAREKFRQAILSLEGSDA